jgi:hypothetical protein
MFQSLVLVSRKMENLDFNGRTLYVHTNPIQLPHALIPVCIRIVNSTKEYQKLLQEFERTGETIGSIQWG